MKRLFFQAYSQAVDLVQKADEVVQLGLQRRKYRSHSRAHVLVHLTLQSFTRRRSHRSWTRRAVTRIFNLFHLAALHE